MLNASSGWILLLMHTWALIIKPMHNWASIITCAWDIDTWAAECSSIDTEADARPSTTAEHHKLSHSGRTMFQPRIIPGSEQPKNDGHSLLQVTGIENQGGIISRLGWTKMGHRHEKGRTIREPPLLCSGWCMLELWSPFETHGFKSKHCKIKGIF